MFENFDKILKPQYRPLWHDYCRYLQLGWEHFFNNDESAAVKSEQIKLLERAIRKDFPLKDTLLGRLQRAFVAENLSLYLLLEPLQAWQWAAAIGKTETEARVSEIMGRLVSPAARMMMVLSDENPSTYLPMTSLLTARWLLGELEHKSELLSKVKKTRRFWFGKLRGLLKNAFVILAVVKAKKLKFKLAKELNTLAMMTDKLQNNKQPRPEGLDRIKIFLYSCYQFMTIRKRTTQTKGV